MMKNQSKIMPLLWGTFAILVIICVIMDITGIQFNFPSNKKINSFSTKTLLDPNYPATPWNSFKMFAIIVIVWFKMNNGFIKFIKFTLELIFWAAILQGLGLGIILNLNDLNLAALAIVGFVMIAFKGLKNLFGESG